MKDNKNSNVIVHDGFRSENKTTKSNGLTCKAKSDFEGRIISITSKNTLSTTEIYDKMISFLKD